MADQDPVEPLETPEPEPEGSTAESGAIRSGVHRPADGGGGDEGPFRPDHEPPS
jgi:hypothetical protein